MADDGESGTATEERPRPIGGSRVPWIVIAALIVVLGGLAIAMKKGGTKSVTEGARAITVPVADRARTVVVPPCNPPTEINQANASAQAQVTGATVVELPRGGAERTVVVPLCGRAFAGTGAPNVPSSAFVLAPGKAVSEEKPGPTGDPLAKGIKSQLLVPTGSPVRTVIAPPCQNKKKGAEVNSLVLKPPSGSTIAVAPPC